MLKLRPKTWALLFAILIGLVTAPRAHKLHSPDFKVFYVAAQHVFTDPDNLYKVSPDRYLYPPVAAILLTPFAFSENYAIHQWVWHGLLMVMVWLLARPGPWALAALAVLTRYLAITFGYGQINLVLMALLAGAGFWVRSHAARAGALWAVAVSLKVYPAVLAPAFLPKESRRGFYVAIGVGVALLALPFLVFGPALALQLYREFFQALESKGLPLHSHNQSFAALFLRLFTDQSFYLHAVGDTKWTLISLPESLVRGFALGLGAVLAGLSWYKAWGRPERYLSAAAFCFLFLSHLVWKDYFLFLFFPLAQIFYESSRRRSLLLAVGVLALITISSPEIVGPPLSTRFDGACIHLWAAVLVWFTWLKK